MNSAICRQISMDKQGVGTMIYRYTLFSCIVMCLAPGTSEKLLKRRYQDRVSYQEGGTSKGIRMKADQRVFSALNDLQNLSLRK